MNQCGLPKKMALELYKPFLMRELVKRELASNIKVAKKMVEEEDENVWELIEEIIKNHPVLLNRAPTLHRLSIQAFEPTLIEGKAIRLHPLVCSAFNADFDGDQMAVHLVLSQEAQMEAKLLMLATNNIIAPSSGRPIAVPSQDMVMGCYYMTKERKGVKGEGKSFSNKNQLITAYQNGQVAVHALVNVRIDGKTVQTTPGRLMFNTMLPKEVRDYTKTFGKGELGKLIAELYKKFGFEKTSELLDKIKEFGFHYGTLAGITVGIEDLEIPESKKDILEKAENIELKWLRVYYIQGDDRNNNSIFAKILQKEEEGADKFPFTTGTNKYDFINVFKLAEMISKASLQTEVKGIINCCSGKAISLKDKVESFLLENNLNIKLEYGVFPDREYDSPALWGNNKKINEILNKGE